MPSATMTTMSPAKIRRDAANVHARCKIGSNASRTAPATSIAANRYTNWTSAAVAIVDPSIEVVLSGEAEIAPDDGDRLAAHPHDLRFPVLHLDAHLDAAR